MTLLSGASPWRLTVRREVDGVTVLRAVTCAAAALLPDTLFGLPVTALGEHALSPGARGVEGEAVRITCGEGADAEWDNGRLDALTLPESLCSVGDYAFYNCAALRVLRLHDRALRWGSGAFMNCPALREFHLYGAERAGELLALLALERDREMEVILHDLPQGPARLLLPEYTELYEENCPAHHFDYVILGEGYPYHHCFERRQPDLAAYDALFPRLLSTEHEPRNALRIAWWRLRYPAGLSERAEAAYLAYLRSHAAEALAWLLDTRDAEGLSFLLARTEPSRDALERACQSAREERFPEALAQLLEERRRRFPSGWQKTFDL